ncbi:MAG: HPr(Ser) kinase/phosphatase [Candidatus Schekmanbacteria bacterium RBG_13_48_7]|uniref:HPr kinase/phosphorylase n=1 Tax=Candidatus Schekmanbacteria bacterium RBG_13_48_7 TaxID=1817878 RepID=A0A1F7RVW8_9BACT|nr:MAG: HPr(Ser) kinase/phosphatase [Candidatus Schekmanbacteria bacterium RBG_13_48_7]
MIQPKIPLQHLLDDLHDKLELSAFPSSAGFDRFVSDSRIQKPGAALTGLWNLINPDRLQIFGRGESEYLMSLSNENLSDTIMKFCEKDVVGIIVTGDYLVPNVLIEETQKHTIPLMRSSLNSSLFIPLLTAYLDEKLAPTDTRHGVLMDVHGVGVLILGESGIGKSECALDLVVRGHRLVIDDLVHLKRVRMEVIIGSGAPDAGHHMEIRGLGIINLRDLFGVASIRDQKRVQLVVELVRWEDQKEIDRTGLEERQYHILDIPLPFIQMPVAPGRNLAIIIEVAARNQLLRWMGVHSSREFNQKLIRKMNKKENIFSDLLPRGTSGDPIIP